MAQQLLKLRETQVNCAFVAKDNKEVLLIAQAPIAS